MSIIRNLSNEGYHKHDAISKSQLDDIAISPATFLWKKKAPVDTDKLAALDMGTALHCIVLEPDEFKSRFAVEQNFDKRTKSGKEESEAFRLENKDKIILTAEQHRKLLLMRDSLYAHPLAKKFLEEEGECESSIFWNDGLTGEACRIRPDKFLTKRPIILDVKKTADLKKFAVSVYDYRYHVQKAMYCVGFEAEFWEQAEFYFLVVSETVSCGRYPVAVIKLDDEASRIGYELFRRDLNLYHECKQTGVWGGVETLTLPAWAKKGVLNEQRY